jgi:nucleoside-diphosphate-sugar epimerase
LQRLSTVHLLFLKMAGDLVLLTGSTGFIGFRTLIQALSQGYHVRAAIRSESKISLLKAAQATQPYLDQLTFAIVPDIEKEGAFDQAVQGVTYIVHMASPLSKGTDDHEKDLIQPAIRGTLSILRSALKEPGVKRVVITSSVTAVAPSTPGIYTADDVQPDPAGPYPDQMAAYSASKKLAYNRTRDFIVQQSPHFTVVNVMPSFVLGKNELATTTKEVVTGSNALALLPILGGKNPAGAPAFVCHVDDVAVVHIASLDPKIEGNRNFGVNSDINGVQWDDALGIVKKHFPEAVEKGVFPLGGTQTSLPTSFDASKTESVLGIKFRGFEEMIVSLAGHYAAVAAKA